VHEKPQSLLRQAYDTLKRTSSQGNSIMLSILTNLTLVLSTIQIANNLSKHQFTR